MNKNYFFHAISAQLMSVRSLLLYLLPASPSRDAQKLIRKYDGLAEEIAELVAEINTKEGGTIE